MSRWDSGERDTSATPLYVPLKPSCRRPLSRMVISKSPKTPTARYSLSPKSVRGTPRRRNVSESPDISSDENNDGIVAERDSYDDDSEEFDPALIDNQESPRQRFSSNASAEQKDNQSECSKTNYTEETSTSLPLAKYLGWIIICVVAGLAFVYSTHCTDVKSPKHSDDRISNFRNSIREIKKRYPDQNYRTWGEIEAGVVDIINETSKPWTFVLFSNETCTLKRLAQELGKASSKALLSKSSLELHPNDLGEDYGRAIEHWKPEIIAKRTVVVHDLLSISPRAIQAFHTMCDRENPLVEGAVYILTIVTRGNVPAFEKRVKFVEDQLTNRFINKVPDEKLQPLITRLTDGPIIPVKSQISSINCHL